MNSSDRNHCIHRGVISYDVDCASARYRGEALVGRQEQFIYTRNVHPSFSTPKTDLRAWHHCNQQGQEKAWIGRAQCYLGAMILEALRGDAHSASSDRLEMPLLYSVQAQGCRLLPSTCKSCLPPPFSLLFFSPEDSLQSGTRCSQPPNSQLTSKISIQYL